MNTSKIFFSILTCLLLLPLIDRAVAAQLAIESSGMSRSHDVGLLFEPKNMPTVTNSSNTVVLIGKNYVGQCTGRADPEGTAWFFSKINKPTTNLRVIVRNITFGFAGAEKPHTNREYYSGDISEGFLVKFGNSHHGKYLAVRPGRNQFDYIIRNGEKFIASGQFSLTIGQEMLTVERNAVPVLETTCLSHEGDKCTNSITSTSYQCP
jgi:hypothetical protein